MLPSSFSCLLSASSQQSSPLLFFSSASWKRLFCCVPLHVQSVSEKLVSTYLPGHWWYESLTQANAEIVCQQYWSNMTMARIYHMWLILTMTRKVEKLVDVAIAALFKNTLRDCHVSTSCSSNWSTYPLVIHMHCETLEVHLTARLTRAMPCCCCSSLHQRCRLAIVLSLYRFGWHLLLVSFEAQGLSFKWHLWIKHTHTHTTVAKGIVILVMSNCENRRRPLAGTSHKRGDTVDQLATFGRTMILSPRVSLPQNMEEGWFFRLFIMTQKVRESGDVIGSTIN